MHSHTLGAVLCVAARSFEHGIPWDGETYPGATTPLSGGDLRGSSIAFLLPGDGSALLSVAGSLSPGSTGYVHYLMWHNRGIGLTVAGS